MCCGGGEVLLFIDDTISLFVNVLAEMVVAKLIAITEYIKGKSRNRGSVPGDSSWISLTSRLTQNPCSWAGFCSYPRESHLSWNILPIYYSSKVTEKSDPVFVNLLKSPGIDSQSGGPVRQPFLSYRPARLYIGWWNRLLGIDSWAP